MKRLLALFVVLALGLGLAQNNNAMVRVAHLSPDAPNVDVWVDGNRVQALTNVPYRTVSAYLPLPAGERRVQIFVTGQSANPVFAGNLNVMAGRMYTVMATGRVTQGQTPAFAVVPIEDTLPTLASGQTAIRVVHTSPGTPAVDVVVRGQTNPVITNLAFPRASNYLTVPGGTYNFDVRPTGTTTVALPLNNVGLEAGKVYTVFAVGILNNQQTPLTVVVAVDR